MKDKSDLRFRPAVLAMIFGALLSLPVEYLLLQTQRPYERTLTQVVWRLTLWSAGEA